MTPERRILLRDLGLGCWTLVLYATSIEGLPADWQSWFAVAVGGIAALAFAYAAEHTARFDGLVEEFGPHGVAVVVLGVGLAATVAAVAGLLPLAFLAAMGLGAGPALVGYRVVYGVVRPIPERVLDRELRSADS